MYTKLSIHGQSCLTSKSNTFAGKSYRLSRHLEGSRQRIKKTRQPYFVFHSSRYSDWETRNQSNGRKEGGSRQMPKWGQRSYIVWGIIIHRVAIVQEGLTIVASLHPLGSQVSSKDLVWSDSQYIHRRFWQSHPNANCFLSSPMLWCFDCATVMDEVVNKCTRTSSWVLDGYSGPMFLSVVDILCDLQPN